MGITIIVVVVIIVVVIRDNISSISYCYFNLFIFIGHYD